MNLERQRGITIQTAVTSFQWEDVKVNIIDTPGHMDFLAEVYRSFIRIRRSSIISFCKGWHTGTDPYTVSCTTDNEDSDNFFSSIKLTKRGLICQWYIEK